MRYRITILILLALVLGVIFIKPHWGWYIQRLFAGSGADHPLNVNQSLILENESLKAELSELKSVKDQLVKNPPEVLNAWVYARYPFNFKNELLISAGEKNGVLVGQPVTVAAPGGGEENYRRVILGKVIRVFEESALIRTVFDAGFQVSVRTGEEGMRALFSGGLEPKVTLIPKNAKVLPGDSVWSVDPDYPVGTAIGSLLEVRLSPDHTSQEATVILPYEISDIRVVQIITNHGQERLRLP